MSGKKCKDCNGRGQWPEREERGNDITVTTKYCDTCNGRGVIVDDEDIDDFDLADVGATELDDD